MDTLLIIIAFAWSIRIIVNTLSYAEVWWVKEYRWDRMRIHLRTPQGRGFWWPPRCRPPITPKSTLLVLFSLAASGFLVWSLPTPILLRFFTADALSFPVTWILVAILNTPVKLYHAAIIWRAVRKLQMHKPMTVIGITGSYGKTSTKDYLARILSAKFKTLKTEASKNSPVGIAEVILKTLRPEHEVFVVEMGAYKRSEIAEMVRLVRPEVGIVTAINPQHQDLFGTIENTMKAKYELLEGLEGRRIAIVNADDPRTREMGEWARRDGCTVLHWTKETASQKRRKENRTVLKATNIRSDFSGVRFDCLMGKVKVEVTARVLGEHEVGNMLAAIAGAVAVGMTLREAAAAAGAVVSAKGVMEKMPGASGSMYINDTFNNNPDAALAALQFLAKSTARKILVFQPMIELGAYASSSHKKVGQYAGRVCDDILLTNENWKNDFLTGVRRVNQTVPVLVLRPKEAASYIRRLIKKGDTVLFKGKEAAHVLRELDTTRQ